MESWLIPPALFPGCGGDGPQKTALIQEGFGDSAWVRTIEVVQRLAPHLDVKAEVQRIELRESEDTDSVAVMPGATDLIRSIPDDVGA